MTHEKFIKDYTNPKRDSIMAANIIEKYKNVIAKQRRKKALVIMNSRHGYGLINNKFNDAIKIEYNGTTAFLCVAILTLDLILPAALLEMINLMRHFLIHLP